MDQIVDRVLANPESTRFQVLAPIIRGKKGEHHKIFENAKRSGFARVRVDGSIYDLSEEIKLAKELLKPSTGSTIYILDETTTGLHVADVHRLIEVMHALVEVKVAVLFVPERLNRWGTVKKAIPEGIWLKWYNVYCDKYYYRKT